MLLAAEYTATTLVAWAIVALVVGFASGWLLRPWLVADRLREEYEGRLADLQRRRDETAAALAAETDDLASSKTELDALRGQHAAAKADLAAATEKSAELETQLADLATEKDAEITRLSAEAGKVGGLEVALAERNTQLASRDAELAEARSGLRDRDARVGELEARIVGLEEEAQARRDADEASEAQPQAGQRRQRDRAAAAAAFDAGDSGAPAAPPDRETATRKVAEIAARTRGDAAAADDDLTRVRGIGPAIERMLKEMGMTSFRQIAGLAGDDIAYVATALDTPLDRIERDDWMTSAARLHEEKYGSTP